MTHKRNGLYRISHARYQIHRLGVRVADRLRMISLDERPLLELNRDSEGFSRHAGDDAVSC
jgi:hypothetical protein